MLYRCLDTPLHLLTLPSHYTQIWIATFLLLRIYRPVGMLLLLLTEALQGIFSFLVLLFFIIVGK